VKLQFLNYVKDLLVTTPMLLSAGCAPLRSRPYSGGPQIGSVTFTRTSNACVADAYSGKLQFPARWIMLASSGPVQANNGDSLCMHFKPLGKTYPGAILTANVSGGEPWVPFIVNYTAGTSVRVCSFIKFTEQALCQEFWLDIGSESGTMTGVYTFIYSNDIEQVYIPARVNGTA